MPRSSVFHRFPVASLVSTLVAGCAGTPNTNLSQASEQRDLDALEAECKKVDVVAYARASGTPDAKKAACRAYERVKKLVAAEGTECASIVDAFEGIHQKDRRFFETMAVRFAECERYDALFERIALYGHNHEGAEMLAMVERQGFPVRERWFTYAEQHQGESFLANDTDEKMLYTGKNMAFWLSATDELTACEPTAQAAMGAREPVILGMTTYFESAECSDATTLATSALRAGFPDLRSWGCRMMVKKRQESALPRMLEIAGTDSFCQTTTEIRDGRVADVTRCPVRSACSSSADALQDILALER